MRWRSRLASRLTAPLLGRVALAAVVGACAGLLVFGPLGRTEATVGPGRVEVSASPAREGATVVALPPLGQVSAATHDAPLQVTARVLSVDVEAAQDVTLGPDPIASLRADVDAALPRVLRTFVLRALLAACVAGAVAALVLPGRQWWYAGAGAVGGLLAVGSLLAAAWAPYDIKAFDEPRLSGALERVPGLLVAVERNLEDLDQVRDRVGVVSGRVAELYAASVGELPGGGPGETSILHVSDLHLNPLGAELVVRLAEDLAVDAVLDTGDVTSFGLPVEARIGDLLDEVPVPYLLVPGNHDSLVNRAELAELAGITVLDGDVVTVGDVRVLGVADPSFTASNEVSTEEANEIKASLSDDVRDEVLAAEPDVLAVHDPAQAVDATGVVPVVVAGHVHERTEELVDGTWVFTIGSTGATGLGSFTVETSLPYEAEVLRFLDGELVAVDHITVSGLRGDFTLDRRRIDPDEAASQSDIRPPERPQP